MLSSKIIPFTRVKFCGVGDFVLHYADQSTGAVQTDCRPFCMFAKDGRCISYEIGNIKQNEKQI